MLLEEKFLEFHRYASSHNLPLEAISVGDENKVLCEMHYAANAPRNIYSHTKSFTVTAVGLAIEEGKLSLEDHVAEVFKDKLPSNIGGIPILIPIALLFIVVIWFVLNKTVFGKNVYAIGGNREAAVVSGINVPMTIVGIFVLASALYGVGGVLEAARTAGATNNYGVGYELDAIAACVVGGVSLNGGVGKVSGIIIGVLIFTIIQYGLQFIGVNAMWQQVIKGVIIAVAVAIDLSKYRGK